jgi:hypothetical protein
MGDHCTLVSPASPAEIQGLRGSAREIVESRYEATTRTLTISCRHATSSALGSVQANLQQRATWTSVLVFVGAQQSLHF